MARRIIIVVGYAGASAESLYLGFDNGKALDAFQEADPAKFDQVELFRYPAASRRRKFAGVDTDSSSAAQPKEPKPKAPAKSKAKGKAAKKDKTEQTEKAADQGDSAKEDKTEVPESGTEEEKFD